MSTIKTKKVQVGTDSTASNNFTIYTPGTPDGTVRIGNGNADSPTEVGRFDANGYAANNIQIGTDATSSNNFTIYQPATPDGTLRIGVGNADSPTEVARFNSDGMIDANLPVFHAKLSTGQSVSHSTWTKVALDTTRFDSKGWFDTTTNYRYTPQIAGYYHFSFGMYATGSGIGGVTVAVRKNGSEDDGARGAYLEAYATEASHSAGSGLIYMNGTTDYIELYGWVAYSTSGNFSTNNGTSLYGHLVKQG
jgi:hypothetical protein